MLHFGACLVGFPAAVECQTGLPLTVGMDLLVCGWYMCQVEAVAWRDVACWKPSQIACASRMDCIACAPGVNVVWLCLVLEELKLC